MKTRTTYGIYKVRSQGAALIILMMLIAIITIALVTSSLSHSHAQLDREKKTEEALAMAKKALLAYASSDDARPPGELPCPDYNGDGQIQISGIDYVGSNCKTYTGYLPWKTLGLPDIRDGNGERLWYSVSQAFHANTSVPPNTNTVGQITITGTSPANYVIAIIISPGEILAGQVQDSTYQNQAVLTNPANYLEGSNAIGGTNTNFVTANTSTTFDDRILPITHHDLFQGVTARIAGEIKILLNPPYPSTSPLISSDPYQWQSYWNPPVTNYTLNTGGGSPTATVSFSNCGMIYTINLHPSTGNTITWSGTC